MLSNFALPRSYKKTLSKNIWSYTIYTERIFGRSLCKREATQFETHCFIARIQVKKSKITRSRIKELAMVIQFAGPSSFHRHTSTDLDAHMGQWVSSFVKIDHIITMQLKNKSLSSAGTLLSLKHLYWKLSVGCSRLSSHYEVEAVVLVRGSG